MEETKVIKRLILQKLVRSNTWGGKHTPLDFIRKGIPEHFRNTPAGKRVLERAVKELHNEELIILLLKRTGKGSGEHISLNSRKLKEIEKSVE
jgi:hypothetical protein